MPKVNYYLPEDFTCDLPIWCSGVGVHHEQEHRRYVIGDRYVPLLHMTVSGCGMIKTNGRTYLLPMGSVMYTPPDINIEFRAAPGGWINNWVRIYGNAGRPHEESFHFLNFGANFLIFQPSDPQKIFRLYEDIYREMTSGSIAGRYRSAAILYSMMVELSADIEQIYQKQNPYNRIITDAIQYIEANFNSQISLPDLCNACGKISEQHLCRVFRTETGKRPFEYIAHRRIEFARTLITETNLPISEVASRAGFESTSYFYRVWKQYQSMSPLEYRRMYQGVFV